MDLSLKSNYKKIIFSVILNIAIYCIFIITNPTLYSLGDEQEFAQLIADSFYHITFSNYFLCCILGFIQNIIYPLNAFVIAHLALSLLCFITITKVFLDKHSILFSTCVTLFISGFFAINHYVTVSFSYLPTLLTITGFLCVIYYSVREKWKIGVSYGAALAIIGSTYRFQIFEVSCAVAALYIFGKSITDYFAIENKKRSFIDFLKILFEKKRLIICCIVLVLSFALNIASNSINVSTPELKYYKEYTNARSAIWDYPVPDYEDCKEEYDKIGIDKNDIAMLRAQYMDDEGAFPINKLYDIKDIKTSKESETKSIMGIIKDMVVSEIGIIKAQGDKGIASLAGGIVLLLFLILMKKRNYFIPAMLILITALVYLYLWIIGRPVYRALYMTWFGMVVFLFYSISYLEVRDYVKKIYHNRKRLFKATVAIICVIISAFGLHFSRVGNFTDSTVTASKDDYKLMEYMDNNKDNRYEIARSCSFCNNTNKDIFHITKRNPNRNYLYNKGTYYKLPYYIEVFKDFGTDNYYSNLLNQNVYFVDSINGQDTKMMQKYLQKYYSKGKTLNYKTVDSFNGFKIIKYSLE